MLIRECAIQTISKGMYEGVRPTFQEIASYKMTRRKPKCATLVDSGAAHSSNGQPSGEL